MKIASPQRNQDPYSYLPYYANVICVALGQLNDRLCVRNSGYLAHFPAYRDGRRSHGKKVSTYCGNVVRNGNFNSADGNEWGKNPVEA